MDKSSDLRRVGFELLAKGAGVAFEVVDQKIETPPGGDQTYVHIDLLLGEPDEDDPEYRSEDHEWGSLGFFFCIGALSFADARPRGISDIHYVDDDEFTLADLLEHIRYVRGELHFSTDYVRGRCMKTDVTIRKDGSATIETHNRGQVALRWIDRLKGKKILELVQSADGPGEDE